MTDDCRLLYRQGDDLLDVPGNGAPRGNSKESIVARNNLGEFLDAALMQPLHFTGEQQQLRVERALNTMTTAERIAIEIEMTERSRVTHSYDYDALR